MNKRELMSAAGLLTLAGAARLLTVSGTANAALSTTATASRMFLEVDGKVLGQIVSAKGGEPVLTPTRDPATGRTGFVRSAMPLEIVTLDTPDVLREWIAKAQASNVVHDVAVLVADFNFEVNYRLALTGAVLESIAMGKLDASTGEPTRLAWTFRTSQSAHQPGNRGNVSGAVVGTKTKLLRANQFAVFIEGLEQTTRFVSAVDGLALRRTSTGLLMPDVLKMTVRFADVGVFAAWQAELFSGKAGEKQGVVHLLAADLKTVVGTVDLVGLTPLRIGMEHGDAEKVARAEVELFCRAQNWKLP